MSANGSTATEVTSAGNGSSAESGANRQTAARKKQKQTQVKEIKFRPGTEEGDYQVKLRNLIRFLENGDKAKVTCRFLVREMAHQDIGLTLMMRVAEDLQEYG